MNAIIGLSVASLSGEATPFIRSSLEKINTSAQFLLLLVNDILDMSKIENDKMHIETALCACARWPSASRACSASRLRRRGILLEARAATPTTPWWGDVMCGCSRCWRTCWVQRA